MKKTRSTRQKEIISRNLKDFNKLFTAEDLLIAARKEDKNIGIATVYRFLKEFSVKEHIHSYDCDRRKVYSTTTNSHCHFICTECGKTSHFKVKKVDFLKESINGDICHFQIDVYGICDKCKRNI